MTASSDPRAPAYVQMPSVRHAIIEGRYPEADRLNAEASAAAARLHDRTLDVLGMYQLFGLRWCTGAASRSWSRRSARSPKATSTPAWQAALVRDVRGARVRGGGPAPLRTHCGRRLHRIPRYNGWLVTLGCLRRGLRGARRPDRAQQLYELLLPFAGRNVLTPQAVYRGPVDASWASSRHVRRVGDGDEPLHGPRASPRADDSPPVMLRLTIDEARMLGTRLCRRRERALGELLDAAHRLRTGLRVEPAVAAIEALRADLESGGRGSAEETTASEPPAPTAANCAARATCGPSTTRPARCGSGTERDALPGVAAGEPRRRDACAELAAPGSSRRTGGAGARPAPTRHSRRRRRVAPRSGGEGGVR